MNGCGWCDRFEPTWKILESKYKTLKCESDNIVNQEETRKVQENVGPISSFPTIVVRYNNKYYRYEGERTDNAISVFINNLKHNTSESVFNKGLESVMTGKDLISLYLFHMNGCGWCDKFMPVWTKLKSKHSEFTYYDCERSELNTSVEANDIQQSLDLKISSFPSIFIKINDEYYKYEGKRDIKNILTFIAEKLRKNKLIQDGGQINYRNKYKKYKQMYADLLEKYNKLIN